MITSMRRVLVALAWVVLVGAPAHAADVSGAGSTFVAPLIWKWAASFKSPEAKISYLSIGSGGGIAQIKAGNVDFGATDMPLSPDELAKSGLGQFPITIGGVVPIVNLDRVRPGQIRFTGKLLADIYLGTIQKWSDPAIKTLNPDLALPDEKITVVHRVDASGTTFNWANFLAKASADWHDQIGEGTALDWPTGIGAKGNEGVAASVGQLRNSIGYVEYTYVLQNNLTYGLVQNRTGHFVSPSRDSFQAAAVTVDWSSAPSFDVVLTDAPGADAYPITATTFILMHKEPADPAPNSAALAFFDWGLSQGQTLAAELGYVPLPQSLMDQVRSYWKADFRFGS
jgi:phosphate transport system substrate-binding protein